jgi:hypothetical protein
VKLLAPLALVLAAPLAGQQAAPADPLWSLSASVGTAFGGPSRVMGLHLTEEGWTDTGCTPKGTDCHANPEVARPRLQFAGALGRRVGRRFEARGILAGANLGSAGGKRADTEVLASWGVLSLAAVVLFKPLPSLRLGGGPLLALLRGDTPGGVATTVWRGGFVLESGMRTSVGAPFFLDLSAAYRHMAQRTEGPWPTRKFSSIGGGGPSPLALDYSHLSLGLGLGAWF